MRSSCPHECIRWNWALPDAPCVRVSGLADTDTGRIRSEAPMLRNILTEKELDVAGRKSVFSQHRAKRRRLRKV